ncbi:hypothetical protein BASA62_003126 [Batrachochytrium salamandrivorans]|nr:hypothetical protein BASA62_003126 [Batrachochytrium salamandrivorans]
MDRTSLPRRNTTPSSTNISIRTHSATREYYGFVIYLSSILALLIYCAWAVLPDKALRGIGITYYPSRHWALVVPIWILGLIPFTLMMFTAINLLNTPTFESFKTLTDEHARMMSLTSDSLDRILQPQLIPKLEDVPITLVNRCFSHGIISREQTPLTANTPSEISFLTGIIPQCTSPSPPNDDMDSSSLHNISPGVGITEGFTGIRGRSRTNQ